MAWGSRIALALPAVGDDGTVLQMFELRETFEEALEKVAPIQGGASSTLENRTNHTFTIAGEDGHDRPLFLPFTVPFVWLERFEVSDPLPSEDGLGL